MLGTIEVEHVNVKRVRGTDDSRTYFWIWLCSVVTTYINAFLWNWLCRLMCVVSVYIYRWLSFRVLQPSLTSSPIASLFLSSQNYEIVVHFLPPHPHQPSLCTHSTRWDCECRRAKTWKIVWLEKSLKNCRIPLDARLYR